MKTLFLLDPVVQTNEECEPLNQMVLPTFHNTRALPQDFRLKLPLIGFFFQQGQIMQIVNANRTAASYRTAFSYFLAEQTTSAPQPG